MSQEITHWADSTAKKILQKHINADSICCASGITPSGTIHIGNFREIITTELIVRALKNQTNKNIRFIYSWDDYDVFRKIPGNMPNQDMLKKYLRKPIVDIPDPYERDESYARHHEIDVEKLLPKVGINPEFLYQAQKYRNKEYAEGMKIALEQRMKIKEILDTYRKEPLPDSYVPIRIFCEKCNKDTVEVIEYKGDYKVYYKCDCGFEEIFDLREKGIAKLSWRIDWPMRWKHENVVFEPGGKDHSSPGGSYKTGKIIAEKVYNYLAPMYTMYDFVRIKGVDGKVSSSTGNVITLKDVLEVYEPQMVRWLFAGTRPGTEFAISFDVDVIKLYEDFDKCERIYFNSELAKNEKEALQQKRIYELSQIDSDFKLNETEQVGFRHITTILLIYEHDIEKTFRFLNSECTNVSKERLQTRIQCASNWLKKYAPDGFTFSVNSKSDYEVSAEIKPAILKLIEFLETESDAEKIGMNIYTYCKESNINPKDFFRSCYQILIKRDKGPKLVPFIQIIGVKRAILLFEQSINLSK